jgi:hypothetical protein
MRFAKEWSEDNQILQRDDPPASGDFGNWLRRRSWRSKRKLGQLQNSQRGFSYRVAVIVNCWNNKAVPSHGESQRVTKWGKIINYLLVFVKCSLHCGCDCRAGFHGEMLLVC